MSNKYRVIVIGLDGGTFSVLKPLAANGYLPNVAKIIDGGTTGTLLSSIPPVTGPAWVSFLTGKQPGKHGIFDFFGRIPGKVERQPINSGFIKAKTILSYLTESGKKVGIINVPVTYPPPKINGFVIPGLMTPNREVDFTYPPELKVEIEKKFGPYHLDVFWQKYSPRTAHLFLQDLKRCEEQRIKITLDLFEKDTWDFFMTVFAGVDRIQHAMWKYIDMIIHEDETESNNKKSVKKQNSLKKEILSYYGLVDDAIGELLNKCNDRTFLFLMSDHGFGPLERKFYINSYLCQEGFLSFDKKAIQRDIFYKKIRYSLRNMAMELHVLGLIKKMSLMKERGDVKKRAMSYSFLQFINWSKTKAYCASNTEQGIYINLKGREPYGIVSPGEEYESVCDEIINKLQEIQDPFSTEKLVSHIYKKKEIYSGPYIDFAPDIIFFLRNGLYLADVQLKDRTWQETNWLTGSGTHRPDGIFMAYGKNIRGGNYIDGANIVDLAPTILYSLGIPVSSGMDGRVMMEVFEENFINSHPIIENKDSGEFLDLSDDQQSVYSEKEAGEVMEKLKDLGYLD